MDILSPARWVTFAVFAAGVANVANVFFNYRILSLQSFKGEFYPVMHDFPRVA